MYSAKAGCSSLRRLFLKVHEHEFSDEIKKQLNTYHNLNELFPYECDRDYSGFRTYLISRNPYDRIVSAFLDQYVYYRGDHMQRMLNEYGEQREPSNFIEFLHFLKSVPDAERDMHFQTQVYFAHAPSIVTPRDFYFKWFGRKPEDAFGVDSVFDIKNFENAMRRQYKRVFRKNVPMRQHALDQLAQVKKTNSSFYGHENYDDASKLSVEEINCIVFAPKPQDFLVDPQAVKLIQEIYAQDFKLLGYNPARLPNKKAAKEIEDVPKDFDWKMYLRLNPDLHLRPEEFYNERTIVRHYLEFGRYEEPFRAYRLEKPEGFDWRSYLEVNKDLVRAGITTEEAAIEHYLGYGVREYRKTR